MKKLSITKNNMEIIRRIDSETGGMRFYEGVEVDQDGNEKQNWCYPSVTSILGEVYPSGYYLEKYIRDNGEHGRIEFEKAGDEGTEAHVIIENLINGESVPTFDLSPKVKKCVQAFIDWYNEFKPEILETEQIVVNHEYKYAGALDLYCKIDCGKYKGTYIVDFKTSKSVHPQHKVQVGAYLKAKDVGAKSAILHLGNTTKAKWSFLEFDPLEYWEQFQLFKKVFDKLNPDPKPSGIVYPETFSLKK